MVRACHGCTTMGRVRTEGGEGKPGARQGQVVQPGTVVPHATTSSPLHVPLTEGQFVLPGYRPLHPAPFMYRSPKVKLYCPGTFRNTSMV